MIVDEILIDIPEDTGQFRREHATDSNRIAMPPLEMLDLFDGVTERVPVVEEFT